MKSRIGLIAIILCLFMIFSCKAITKPQQPYVFPVSLVVSSAPDRDKSETEASSDEIIEGNFEISSTEALRDEQMEENFGINSEVIIEEEEKIEEETMDEQEQIVEEEKKVEDVVDQNNIGNSNVDTSKFEEAIEACKSAIKMKPDYVEAYYKLGSMYTELGLYDEAIEAYEKYIRINSGNAEVYYNLGVTYLMIDDLDAAMEKYKILRKYNTQLADTFYEAIIQNVLMDEESKFVVQVAAYKNIAYANEMIENLKGIYKHVYIKKENNFNKVRIVGIKTRSEGKLLIKDLKSKFRLKPIIKKT